MVVHFNVPRMLRKCEYGRESKEIFLTKTYQFHYQITWLEMGWCEVICQQVYNEFLALAMLEDNELNALLPLSHL